ncbi:MAG: ABC-F family ATP-binding cassette domain-containing protein [Clostridia bacterium]|nr:ABC-F family ATP-binding cassette domain-containing protein [Clostridia bacterium]
MTLMNAAGLELSFGTRRVFGDVNFLIDERDHVGLVGVNGCGKTSLFKVLTGEYSADGGNFGKSRLARIGYVEQYAVSGNRSVFDELLTVFDDLKEIDRRLNELNGLISEGKGDMEALIEEQHRLTEAYNDRGGLTYRSRARSALLGLGFTEQQLTQGVNTLSGGQRSKVQLCKMLLSNANLLLLDEPTNHLDISSVEWLEDFLRSFKGAYIVISHDRYFLDRVTNRTFELENGRLTVYNGNYSHYIDKKAENREIAIRHFENTQREIKRIEGIVEQQRRWNREKNIRTAESKLKQIERLKKTLVAVDRLPEDFSFHFPVKNESGNDVLKGSDLCFAYGAKEIFHDVNIDIKKGERVFLLGPNGCGKTTLFKMLCSRLGGTKGYISLGSNVDIGYYDQTQESLHDSKTVLYEVWDEYPRMTETEVRSSLAAFLFKGDDVFKSISTLSGGERARVAILKLMLCRCNLLLLDEPTNHLDIISREALEMALTCYEGTIFMVSHDRYFINRLADRIYYMDNGQVTEYVGNYDDFTAFRAAHPQDAGAPSPAPVNAEKEKRVNDYKQRKEAAAAERKRQKQIGNAEQEIERLESQIIEINERLTQPEISSDYAKIMELTKQAADMQETVDGLYALLDELYD